MEMDLIQLATGGVGGLIGGNILGAIFKRGAGVNSLVGIIGGALATQFFGAEYGPMIGGILGEYGSDPTNLANIVGNLGVGAGGGGILGLVIGLVRSLFR